MELTQIPNNPTSLKSIGELSVRNGNAQMEDVEAATLLPGLLLAAVLAIHHAVLCQIHVRYIDPF